MNTTIFHETYEWISQKADSKIASLYDLTKDPHHSFFEKSKHLTMYHSVGRGIHLLAAASITTIKSAELVTGAIIGVISIPCNLVGYKGLDNYSIESLFNGNRLVP